jgi:ABC-type transport system substrate-binding protein
LILALLPTLAYSQELNIGTPLADKASSIIKGADPFAVFVRSAVLQTLVKKKQNGQPSLIMADSINFSADGREIELRLRSGLFFTDGNSVKGEDLQASLESCFAQFDNKSIQSQVLTKSDRIYVKVVSESGASYILDSLSNCPIISKTSIRIFGINLAEFNLLVGSGPYLLNSRHKNRDAVMTTSGLGPVWAKTINIRGLRDGEQGLSALQAGTLDLFYTQDAQALEKAGEDATLRIADCGINKVVYRNGLRFDCLQTFDPASIRYIEE